MQIDPSRGATAALPSHPVAATAAIPAIAAMALFALASAVTAQSSVVSPADRETLEGSTSTSYPLGRFDSRFQQLFDDLGPARTIAGHAYRRDALGTRGNIDSFKTSMTIQLSLAQVPAAQADRTFANNAGASPSTVLPTTWMDFPLTQRPATVPAPFLFVIPYKTAYVWPGQATLCLDMTIDSNELATGKDKTFSPAIDAHTLYASGRNVQPGYPFGQGCPAPGQSRPASAVFEVRHLGATVDLDIDARDGVPTTAAEAGLSVLLLSRDATPFPWPPGSSCQVYGSAPEVLFLTGANSVAGDWSGTIPVGLAPIPGFEMTGQVLSYAVSGAIALSDPSRLIAPPPAAGLVSSRIVNASDHTAATGTVSFAVPVTEFR